MERDFTCFSQAMIENGRSRVYLGVHSFFDDLVGQNLGSGIAEYVASRSFVAAVPEPSTATLAVAMFVLLGVKSINCTK